MTYLEQDHFAAALANAGLGIAGNTLYDNTAIAEAITEIDDMINAELGVTSNITDAPWLGLMKKIATDLGGMFVLRARHYRENNLMDNVVQFWQYTPTFTYDHQRIFAKYRNAHPRFSTHNISTGARLS